MKPYQKDLTWMRVSTGALIESFQRTYGVHDNDLFVLVMSIYAIVLEAVAVFNLGDECVLFILNGWC